jgi:predicted  nucleic acid-binding Zn-ribbon protein
MKNIIGCLRCGHIWKPRSYNFPPKICPNCKTKKWNEQKNNTEPGPKRLKVPGDEFGKKNRFYKIIKGTLKARYPDKRSISG